MVISYKINEMCARSSIYFSVINSSENDDEEVPPKKRKLVNQSSAEYDCPKDGCMRLFKTATALEQHVTLGNCDYKLEKHSLDDKVKLMYGERVNMLPIAKKIGLQESDKESEKDNGEHPNLQKGWALRQKKKKSVFSDKQINFMKEKFEGGKKSGRKTDPFIAAEEMRTLKSARQFVFTKEEYLTGQQVASFFSRLALKDKKTDKYDLIAAKQEDKEDQVTHDILATVSV